MLRGGAWNNNARNLRAAERNRNEPDNRNNNIGFRVARDVERSRERGFEAGAVEIMVSAGVPFHFRIAIPAPGIELPAPNIQQAPVRW